MCADRKDGVDPKPWMVSGSGSHGAGRLTDRDDVNGKGEKGRSPGIGDRERHGTTGARAPDRRVDDRQQIRSERADRARQWTLFGSDQADKRVTRSNSRRSWATTWSASALVDSVST